MSGADVRGPETIDRDTGARRVGWRRLVAPLFALGVLVGACGGGDDGGDAGAEAPADAPTVVVSSNILGDVVESIAGDDIRVVTLMPVGVDPHEFERSKISLCHVVTFAWKGSPCQRHCQILQADKPTRLYMWQPTKQYL